MSGDFEFLKMFSQIECDDEDVKQVIFHDIPQLKAEVSTLRHLIFEFFHNSAGIDMHLNAQKYEKYFSEYLESEAAKLAMEKGRLKKDI